VVVWLGVWPGLRQGFVSRSRLDETGRAIRRLAVGLAASLACELQPYASCRFTVSYNPYQI
jgi:hypothetical protein